MHKIYPRAAIYVCIKHGPQFTRKIENGMQTTAAYVYSMNGDVNNIILSSKKKEKSHTILQYSILSQPLIYYIISNYTIYELNENIYNRLFY